MEVQHLEESSQRPGSPQTAACMLAQDTRCPDFDKPLPLQAPTTHIQGTPLLSENLPLSQIGPASFRNNLYKEARTVGFAPGDSGHISAKATYTKDVHVSRFPTWTEPHVVFHKKAGGPVGGLTKQGTSMERKGRE